MDSSAELVDDLVLVDQLAARGGVGLDIGDVCFLGRLPVGVVEPR